MHNGVDAHVPTHHVNEEHGGVLIFKWFTVLLKSNLQTVPIAAGQD